MRKETISAKSPRKSSASSAAKVRASDFAALFGFNVRSLQDWEQGRPRPEIPIRAYLAVIQRAPEAVIRALRAA